MDEAAAPTQQTTADGHIEGDGEMTVAPAMWAIRAHGEVDIHSAEKLAAQLDAVIDQGALLVMLDLDRVTFLDSSGLRAIARAGERLKERNGRLLIEGASGAVARVLEITGLLEHYAVGTDQAD